jgi:hypothetical protein
MCSSMSAKHVGIYFRITLSRSLAPVDRVSLVAVYLSIRSPRFVYLVQIHYFIKDVLRQFLEDDHDRHSRDYATLNASTFPVYFTTLLQCLTMEFCSCVHRATEGTEVIEASQQGASNLGESLVWIVSKWADLINFTKIDKPKIVTAQVIMNVAIN